MSEINHGTNDPLTSSLANYSLIEIVHHMVGNELAIISGYTQLLLREEMERGKKIAPLNWEKLAQREEKRLYYLQVMKQSEERMENFLIQLRGCPLALAERHFHEHQVKTDFVSLFKQYIDNLAPLYKNRILRTQLPVQPLYVLCNHLWMTLVLEHVVTYTLAAHTASSPVVIEVEEYVDPSHDFYTVRIGIHITRRSTKQKSGTEKTVEIPPHTLDEREHDLCVALCGAILREHGGRFRIEQEAEQGEAVYIALPLVK